MSFIDQESHTQSFEIRVRPQLFEYPRKLLQRCDNDGLAFAEKPRQMVGLLRDPNDFLQVREVLDVVRRSYSANDGLSG